MNKYYTSRLFKLLLFALLAFPTSSCVRPVTVGPIKAIQFCFTIDKDVNYLKALLQTIALKEHMEYSDISGEQYDRLVKSEVNAIMRMRREKFITVYFGSGDGLGVWATNTSTEDQVIINTHGGRDRQVAIAFSDRVEASLKKDWKIYTSEGGTPNYPLDCTAQQ
ncbi:MAG: hypothetical protein AAB680_07295 [Pseudomonadota bacterium]